VSRFEDQDKQATSINKQQAKTKTKTLEGGNQLTQHHGHNKSHKRNMNHPNRLQQSNPREELVDKLHGTLSILRRERDELHRAKQLAVERLRLIKEERVAAEENLLILRDKYDRIISSNVQDERRGEIAKLQSEVERLGREVRSSNFRSFEIQCLLTVPQFSPITILTVSNFMHVLNQAKFQHMELVGKREKMNKLKSCIQEEVLEYSKHLRTAKEALHIRREKVAVRQANHASVASNESSNVEKMNKLLAENGNGDSMDFFLKIQRLVEKKTAEVEDETNVLRVETEAANKRVAGYEQYMQKDDGMDAYAGNLAPVLQQ
jgi:hypothetical protein